ncbi:MAG TPA: hypothetical protein PLM93_01570 [Sulfuricurvum sp.]|nr:MAG: hypothetical protein B7Y30_07655 [Campylobacterales bacterium 16-40-21]OZA03627.1 MAG: hypothetical protein B7X89_02875 [Sulfuricurvum sp. 17-40-25]HQS65858.1 hypothetical protein [Sulfuricurvum sp.]HQT36985.1 hypothetical protein [Sulfuricurvum sp.]
MRAFLLFSLFILVVTGCSVTTYNRSITHGKVENPDIIITAEDKSFSLKGEFTSPFQSSTRYNSLEMPDRDLPKAYRQALHHGAKHVRIKVANSDKEFFGVLALDKADDDGVGPSTQSYKIIVPQAYIDAAKNGKISVVYEYYKLKNDGLIDIGKIKERSWILWLSDQDVFK